MRPLRRSTRRAAPGRASLRGVGLRGVGLRGVGLRGVAMLAVALLAMVCVLGVPTTALASPGLAAAPGGDAPTSVEPLASSCADDDGPGLLAPEPICEIVAIDPDEDGFFAAAPLCDPSGTSAVAPQPVHPIGNDRIEAPPGCDEVPSTLALDRSNDETPPRPLTSAMDHALLPELIPPPRWWGQVTDAGPGCLLGPSDGARRGVEHPPTAG